MLTDSELGGSAKFMVFPSMNGYDCRTMFVTIVRITSASTRKALVSDQFRTEILSFGDSSFTGWSTLTKWHGPAMHETRTFRNSLPGSVLMGRIVRVAFHLPSGEHGFMFRQGMLPLFGAMNSLAIAPTEIVDSFLNE